MIKYILHIVLVTASFGLQAQNVQQYEEQKENSIISVLVDKKWNGNGILIGKEATFMMHWQKVLQDNFIKLEFQNERKSDSGKDIVFTATAFYKKVNDTTVVGNWYGNRGVTFGLKGTTKENELTIFWGDENTEMGKTIYRYSGDGIYVEDYIMNKGKYSKFATASYTVSD